MELTRELTRELNYPSLCETKTLITGNMVNICLLQLISTPILTRWMPPPIIADLGSHSIIAHDKKERLQQIAS